MALWRRLALHNNRLAWCFPTSISLKGDIITDTRPHLLIAGKWKKVVEPAVTTTGIVGGVVTVRLPPEEHYHHAEASYTDPIIVMGIPIYQSKTTVIIDKTFSDPITVTWNLNIGGAVNSVDGVPLSEVLAAFGKEELKDVPQKFSDIDGKPYDIDGLVYEISAHAAVKCYTTKKTIFESSIKPNWTNVEKEETYEFGVVSATFDENGDILGEGPKGGASISVEMTWHTDTSVEKRYYEPIDDVGFVSATKTA